jgi:hypothetical protein
VRCIRRIRAEMDALAGPGFSPAEFWFSLARRLGNLYRYLVFV